MPSLDFLPPLKRRRLSDAARLFFAAAWPLTEQESNIPVVYASFNGEINRSFALWQQLWKEGDVSPTSFSLSVHNALVGQWSEMRGVKQECTAICANKDNLETALTEAYLLLHDGVQSVLVVTAESPLAAQYPVEPVFRHPFSYALALLVERGERYQLSLHAQPAPSGLYIDNALSWVKQQYLTESCWQTPSSGGGHWLWQRS